MENCKWFEKYFSDYIEGQLDLSLTQKLEQHLANCQYCSAIVQRMRLIKGRLQKVTQLKTNSDFDTILRTRIRIESGLERSSWRDRFNSWSLRLPVYAASIAMIVIAIVLIRGQLNPLNQPGSNIPRSIAVRDSNFSDTKTTLYEITTIPIYNKGFFFNSNTDSSAILTEKPNNTDSVNSQNRMVAPESFSVKNQIQPASKKTYKF